jgi:flagellar basal-body rod protein FlgF
MEVALTAADAPGFARRSGAKPATRQIGWTMDNTSTVALSRLVAQAREMDVTATNIANTGTPGYRGERTLFSDFLVREGGGALGPGADSIAYTQDRATYRDQRQGTLTHTANPLDLAISGEGFFTVQTANGPRLTRAGHFGIGTDGRIVDENANALLDIAGRPLRVATADATLTISGGGTLQSENGEIGKIAVVAPADQMKLQAEGSRLFDASATSTAPATGATITQGAIEDSNIQPTMEVTRMMTQLREFQFVSQFVQGESERQTGAIDKILQKRG